MKRNSKKPEVRRQELIDVAARLFAEKGYESVSVRDILDEIDGAPGMFYYYFKSKQDIYIAAMEQFIARRLERKCAVLTDEKIPFEQKREAFRALIVDDIQGYRARFSAREGGSISDDSYQIWDMTQMLNRMAGPFEQFLLQGIREGKLSGRLGVTEDNARAFALFVLYGAWGVVWNERFSGGQHGPGVADALEVIRQLFY
ncbi:MAG: TetR/AcrR family transcriptional regulator [Clostridia bacterium]|nr:TetR/AcrR family transcriptional regulator [Clostridia bacterium]